MGKAVILRRGPAVANNFSFSSSLWNLALIGPVSLLVSKEMIFSFPILVNLKQVNPFLPPGFNSNNLGRRLQDKATYQI